MLVGSACARQASCTSTYKVTFRSNADESQLHLVPKDPALLKRVSFIDIWLGKDLSPKIRRSPAAGRRDAGGVRARAAKRHAAGLAFR